MVQGSFAERMAKFNQGAKAKAPVFVEESGILNRVEGTVIKLGAASSGDTTVDKSAKYIITDESVGTPKEVPYVLGTEAGVTYTLPDVPDDKISYKVSYKLVYKRGSREVTVSGRGVYHVWPATISFEAKYKKGEGDVSGKNDDDLVTSLPFKVRQGGEVKDAGTTDAITGIGMAPVTPGSEAAIVVSPPWQIVDPVDQAGKPRARGVIKVTSKPWVAQLYSHPTTTTAEAPAKQYVNLDPGPPANNAAFGPLVKVEVGPADLSKGLTGQKIFVRATFAATNSTGVYTNETGLWLGVDPGTAVAKKSGTQGESDVVIETTVTLASNGGKAAFYVNLGLVGGDKCKIEFGSTDAKTDGALFLQNWRKLWLDMWQPTYTSMTTHVNFKPDHSAGLSDAQKTLMSDELKKAFVEFDTKTVGFYAPADLGNANAQRAHILDGAWFESTGKMTVLPEDNTGYEKIETLKWTVKDKKVWFTLWADWMASEDSAGIGFSEVLENTTAKEVEIGTDESPRIFKYDVYSADNPGVELIRWWATEYQPNGTGPWKPIDNGFVAAVGGDAGLASQLANNNDEPVDTLANCEKFIEFTNWRKAKIKLSTSGASAPGNKVTIGTTKIKYNLYVKFKAFTFGTNASALKGSIWMSTQAGAKDQGLMATLLHEMGHNMGLAYGPKLISVQATAQSMSSGKYKRATDTGGRSNSNEIKGLKFPPVVPDGFYYTGHDHTGGHCATGLDTTLRKKPSFQSAEHGAATKCLMFGSGDMKGTTQIPLCPECVKHLSATDLDSITKAW